MCVCVKGIEVGRRMGGYVCVCVCCVCVEGGGANVCFMCRCCEYMCVGGGVSVRNLCVPVCMCIEGMSMWSYVWNPG